MNSACIPWAGFIDPDGYGRVGRHTLAHRDAWETQRGPIPANLVIDHLCRNRACVNIAHMELVTRVENTRRGGNAVKTHCRQGHAYDEVNTYRVGAKRGCRQCNAAAARRYKQRVQA